MYEKKYFYKNFFFSSVNIQTESALRICWKNSLDSILEKFQKYFAVLPLPEIDQNLYDVLPPKIQNFRRISRKANLMIDNLVK